MSCRIGVICLLVEWLKRPLNQALVTLYVCNVCMYVFILQQDNNTQNIKPEGQQGPEALTAARNKNVSNKY